MQVSSSEHCFVSLSPSPFYQVWNLLYIKNSDGNLFSTSTWIIYPNEAIVYSWTTRLEYWSEHCLKIGYDFRPKSFQFVSLYAESPGVDTASLNSLVTNCMLLNSHTWSHKVLCLGDEDAPTLKAIVLFCVAIHRSALFIYLSVVM
jgi:hypothetical protein